MIKAAIFDIDGVIVHGGIFSDHVERDFGISKKITSEFFEGDFQKCLVGKADLKDELEKLIGEWGWNKSVDELLEYWFENGYEFDKRFVPLIRELRNKGIKCCAATNQEKYRTEHLRSQKELRDLFDEFFSSAYIGFKKPQQEFFAHMYQTALVGIEKPKVFFTDDSLENVEGAKQFGFQARLFTDFEHLQTALLDNSSTQEPSQKK
jgi:putative hydrolase of the HAD superfamily